MKPYQKNKIIWNWRKRNGCAKFDLKNRDIILYDGGLFTIEKETLIKPKRRIIIDKKQNSNGNYGCKFIPIKRNGKILKEKVEYYKAQIWFEELNETINYLIRMKKMLNKIGYKTQRLH